MMKVLNHIAVIVGSAFIGHGVQSLWVTVGVCLVAFALLSKD